MFGSTKARIVLVAMLVGALLLVGGAFAIASSSSSQDWKTFGAGWGWSRGHGDDSPEIQVASVTNTKPDVVRFFVTNHQPEARQFEIDWDLECWNGSNEDDDVVDKEGDYEVKIGPNKTHFKKITYNKSPKWCELDVDVDYEHDDAFGKVTVKLQTRY